MGSHHILSHGGQKSRTLNILLNILCNTIKNNTLLVGSSKNTNTVRSNHMKESCLSKQVFLGMSSVMNDVGYSLKEESAGFLTCVKCSQRAQKVHEGALKHVRI